MRPVVSLISKGRMAWCETRNLEAFSQLEADHYGAETKPSSTNNNQTILSYRDHVRVRRQSRVYKMYKFNVLFQPISSLTHVSNSPAKLQEREEFVRESWVKAMEARLVRDELVKCHRLEGVNHLENCRWLSDKYISMLKENKVCVTHTFSLIPLSGRR